MIKTIEKLQVQYMNYNQWPQLQHEKHFPIDETLTILFVLQYLQYLSKLMEFTVVFEMKWKTFSVSQR